MKSLKESLFDKDLVEKEVGFGSKWELTELMCSLGDYYNYYCGSGIDRELEKKTFKSNKLANKRMAETKPSMWKPFGGGYAEDMDFWGDFLKIVQILKDTPWAPKEAPMYRSDVVIPEEFYKEFKKYLVATGGLEIKLYINSNHTASFRIQKNFGSKDKWISFTAIFKEK